MKFDQVRIGEVYIHKHRRVRIISDKGYHDFKIYGGHYAAARTKWKRRHLGWMALNIETKRQVHIKHHKGLMPASNDIDSYGGLSPLPTSSDPKSPVLPEVGVVSVVPGESCLSMHPIELTLAIEAAREDGDHLKAAQIGYLRNHLITLVNHARGVPFEQLPSEVPMPKDTQHRTVTVAEEADFIRKVAARVEYWRNIFQNDVAGLEKLKYVPLATIDVR